MVRVLAMIAALFWPVSAFAQQTVAPDALKLTVTLEETQAVPFQNEMVLLTIHGIYRRHITLEKLEQPDLKGFNWMQLGEDHWFESVVDGKTVKNMRRRMALFPEAPGKLEIGPFIHHLTLLDEDSKWFEHDIRSEPLTLEVKPAPETGDWWFPVRRLEITDRWSNAPDQLGKGEGVLRIITVSALGASPDMIPPMPELKSPSALVFAHPEKRLVDLSPDGPVSIAFWRWTIKPRKPPSAILEPIAFSYFDTVNRKRQRAVISAQKVAISPAEMPAPLSIEARAEPSELQVWWIVAALIAGSAIGVFATGAQGRLFSFQAWGRRARLALLKHRIRISAQRRDLSRLRRACHALNRMLGEKPERCQLLAELDHLLFGRNPDNADLARFSRTFLASL